MRARGQFGKKFAAPTQNNNDAFINSDVSHLLGCTYPILLAGMGGVARHELVAAVINAGGFGFLGMVRESPDLIAEEIRLLQDNIGDRQYGVNLIPAATNPDLFEAEIAVCFRNQVPVIGLFWNHPPDIIKRCNDRGILVSCQVGSRQEAIAAQEAGASFIIAQGNEAGGHVKGQQRLMPLLAEIISAVDVPVVAAGGLADSRDIVGTFSLGAEGVMLGTAFLATHESFAHTYHKERIIRARSTDTCLTKDFHINWPRNAKARVLENSVTAGLRGDPDSTTLVTIGEEKGRPIYLFSTDSPLRSMSGDFEAMALYAGCGVDHIQTIEPAAKRFNDLVESILIAFGPRISEVAATDATISTSSPPCLAKEADPAYMGFADDHEIISFLNILLEGERAGARVALQSKSHEEAELYQKILRDIHLEEARWCAILDKAIRDLNGKPSQSVGLFHDKAMSITNLPERLAYITKGQSWVVKRINQILPRIENYELYNCLDEMRLNHQKSARRIGGYLADLETRF